MESDEKRVFEISSSKYAGNTSSSSPSPLSRTQNTRLLVFFFFPPSQQGGKEWGKEERESTGEPRVKKRRAGHGTERGGRKRPRPIFFFFFILSNQPPLFSGGRPTDRRFSRGKTPFRLSCLPLLSLSLLPRDAKHHVSPVVIGGEVRTADTSRGREGREKKKWLIWRKGDTVKGSLPSFRVPLPSRSFQKGSHRCRRRRRRCLLSASLDLYQK